MHELDLYEWNLGQSTLQNLLIRIEIEGNMSYKGSKIAPELKKAPFLETMPFSV